MYKPFIKLFRTPNRKYFYEPNKNEFITISDESYDFLQAVSNDDDSLTMPKEIQELMDNGYLSEKSVVEKVEHPYTRYIPILLERKINKITLQVTQSCNFRCKYCIYSENANRSQRTHSSKHMSWETAKKAIDFLYEHSVDSEKIYIGFYGGEPLLEFELIKQCIEYGEKKFTGKHLEFSITSNATLLTESIITYFIEHSVNLVISIDGPKEINDKGRVFPDGSGTYAEIMRKIELVKNIDINYAKKINFSMVMNSEDDFECINTITLDLKELDKWNILAAYEDTEYEDDKVINFSEVHIYKREYHKFLSILAYLNRVSLENVSSITYLAIQKFIEEIKRMENSSGLPTIGSPGGPCIPGQLRLFCNADGNLFPCERVSEKSSIMCIGTIKEGFDYNKVSSLLNVGTLTEEECKKCWAFSDCGMCARMADINADKLSPERKLRLCESNKATIYGKYYHALLLKEILELYTEQIRGK